MAFSILLIIFLDMFANLYFHLSTVLYISWLVMFCCGHFSSVSCSTMLYSTQKTDVPLCLMKLCPFTPAACFQIKTHRQYISIINLLANAVSDYPVYSMFNLVQLHSDQQCYVINRFKYSHWNIGECMFKRWLPLWIFALSSSLIDVGFWSAAFHSCLGAQLSSDLKV